MQKLFIKKRKNRVKKKDTKVSKILKAMGT
jgi:hypothetical protein